MSYTITTVIRGFRGKYCGKCDQLCYGVFEKGCKQFRRILGETQLKTHALRCQECLGAEKEWQKAQNSIEPKQLHLVLKRYWYDMIKSGAKRTEFRKCTERYEAAFKDKTVVIFHRGYTKETMQFKINSIRKRIISDADVSAGIAQEKWRGSLFYAIDFEDMEQENETQN